MGSDLLEQSRIRHQVPDMTAEKTKTYTNFRRCNKLEKKCVSVDCVRRVRKMMKDHNEMTGMTVWEMKFS